MRQFDVTGMSCAACQARVERAVSAVPGVASCAVNLLTNSMAVDGEASDAAIVAAVEAAGYGASLQMAANADGNAADAFAAGREALADRETPVLKRRLISSIVFLAVLLYCSMGHGLAGWPLPAALADNPFALGLVEMVLTLAVMVINRRFFISGVKSVLHGGPNMDTLVALGAGVSFLWSAYVLCIMGGVQAGGSGPFATANWAQQLYFDSAAMILTLITVGKLLEARSKGKTTDALRSLMELAPQTATVIRDGSEQVIPAAEVQVGDVFCVRPGESVPVDGVVLEGSSAVDESALTGESIPVDKAPGDAVSAATLNRSGYIRCRAERVGADMLLSQIIQMVRDASATKAPIARVADRVAAVFVPAVIAVAVVTFAAWLLSGHAIDFCLTRAIAVLVISCPCALGLATPVAVMVGTGLGARNGLLFKTASSLEETGKVQIVVLDKTGTITSGQPQVRALLPEDGVSEDELLAAAYALEAKSEHPLARAVVRAAEERGLVAAEVADFCEVTGHGLRATASGTVLKVGSAAFMPGDAVLSQRLQKQAADLADDGCTLLYAAAGNRMLGAIAAADALKPESPEAVRQLEAQGIQVVMLTGDNLRTATAVARQAGIGHVVAGVLPAQKDAVVRRLKELGRVAMVGDGINDAPALTSADIGIAIGAGTDVAIDAADVVLMDSRLTDVPAAIRLSRGTLRNIRQNLFWAFFYNVLCIPLAAGCYTALLGWQLNPMIAAAAMSLSSFCVVSNALRLNLFPLGAAERDRALKNRLQADVVSSALEDLRERTGPMIKTMKIQGMMCPRCEAHVKKALEAIDGVQSAVADHNAGTAVVTLDAEVSDDVLKAAVEAEDYPVLGIE